MDDYYPFGLTYNSYQRENSLKPWFKFQGQEHIDDLDLGWDSFKWRNHQPEIGRFFNVDPLAEKYYYNSPYAFSENKVVAHAELEGLESLSIGSLVLKAVDTYNTIMGFIYGGGDGTSESAANLGEAQNRLKPLKAEVQKMKAEIKENLGDVPGLGSALSVMDAQQS